MFDVKHTDELPTDPRLLIGISFETGDTIRTSFVKDGGVDEISLAIGWLWFGTIWILIRGLLPHGKVGCGFALTEKKIV